MEEEDPPQTDMEPPPPVKGPTTKDKLSVIAKGFQTFDNDMKIGTRQRKEKEEHRIAGLKNEMKKLDTELIAEIKRRTEMNKSLQMWFEQNLLAANNTFHNTLEERNIATTKRTDLLMQKITDLNTYMEDEKSKMLLYIEETGQALARKLNQFKMEFEEDMRQRLAREALMVKRLTDHEQHVNERFEKQIQTREDRYAAVRSTLESNIKHRDKAENKFRTFFEKETHALHNDTRSEKEIREREDDEIIEALNRYTIKLQESLKTVNEYRF